MGDNPPVNTPQPQGQTPEQRRAEFDAWFQDYVKRNEPDSQPNVPQSSSGQQQSGPSIEAAIEAVLTRRERSSQRESRIKKLEDDNASLSSQVKELKTTIDKLGKSAKSVFSIFS